MMKSEGKPISLAEFSRRCHVLQAPNITKDGHKHMVLFDRNEETGTWKFAFRLYVRGGKKSALNEAYNDMLFYIQGFPTNTPQHDDFLNYFCPNYNKKVPIVF